MYEGVIEDVHRCFNLLGLSHDQEEEKKIAIIICLIKEIIKEELNNETV